MLVWSDMSGVLVAFITTTGLIGLLRPLAAPFGLVDVPNTRKQHVGQIPLVGGLAMFAGFWLGASVLTEFSWELGSLFCACLFLVVVGLLDDRHELATSIRFPAQAVAALLIIYGGDVVLLDLGDLTGSGKRVVLGSWAIPITLFAIIGTINAVNFMDGLDGLAGGVVLIVAFSLTLLGWNAGLRMESCLLALLATVVIVFLLFNLHIPGRSCALVFMGDAGSMMLGLMLAWFLIRLSQGPQPIMHPVTALWLFALPLMDTVGCLVRRLVYHQSPFFPDRNHLHHLIQRLGLSTNQSVWLLLFISALCALLGMIGLQDRLSQPIMFYGFLGLFSLYLMTILWVCSPKRTVKTFARTQGE